MSEPSLKSPFVRERLLAAIVLLELASPIAFVQAMSVKPNASAVEEELSWVFDVNRVSHAFVNVTVTIHPPSGKWNSVSFTFPGYRVGNFTASEYLTGKPLPVSVAQRSGGGTAVTVEFGSTRGDGYRFSVFFESVAGFGKLGDGYSLTWTWGGTSFAEPQKVTVIFPIGFDCAQSQGLRCVNVQGVPANFTTNAEKGRVAVSFGGTSPTNDYLTWLVV